jgi:hypothetical protein
MTFQNSFDRATYALVESYLRGDISASELAEWLTPRYWDAVESTADGPFMGAVMNLMWAHQEGHVPELKFREQLETAAMATAVPA